ncbi:hypothetical protein [Streptomyces sp. NPDC048445]
MMTAEEQQANANALAAQEAARQQAAADLIAANAAAEDLAKLTGGQQ